MAGFYINSERVSRMKKFHFSKKNRWQHFMFIYQVGVLYEMEKKEEKLTKKRTSGNVAALRTGRHVLFNYVGPSKHSIGNNCPN